MLKMVSPFRRKFRKHAEVFLNTGSINEVFDKKSDESYLTKLLASRRVANKIINFYLNIFQTLFDKTITIKRKVKSEKVIYFIFQVIT